MSDGRKRPRYRGRPRAWLGELLRAYAERDPPSGLTALQATVQMLLDETNLSDAKQMEMYDRLNRNTPKGDT